MHGEYEHIKQKVYTFYRYGDRKKSDKSQKKTEEKTKIGIAKLKIE